MLLLLCISCTSVSNNKIMFPTKNFKTIKGKQILSDLFIGRPLKMNIVDNKLLMIDKYEGKQITMIDLINTNKIERIANIGEGPNEFLNLRDITYNSKNNSLAFFDGMLRQVSFYKINEHKIQINNNTFHRKVRFNADCPYDIVAFGDYFLANGCFNAKQFALLNSKADIIAEFGVFPGDNTGVEVENSFFLKNRHKAQRKAKFYINKCRSASCMQGGLKQASA